MVRPSRRTKRPPSPLLHSPASSGVNKRPWGLLALIAVSAIVLAYQIPQMPGELPLLLSQTTGISIVDGGSEPSTGSASAAVTTKQDNDLKAEDFMEMLKQRRQKVKNIDPHKDPKPVPQQPQAALPAPELINRQPALLARTDALYQKFTWDKSPIVLEQYRLIFFTVPKVGCTGFKQLFRRMMGYKNWMDHQYYNEPFLPHNPHTNGLRYLSDYPFEKANYMLTAPEWTRAIFVRKPEERALSAYLDKAAMSKGYYLRMRCCDKFPAGSEQHTKLQCATGTKQYTKPAEGEENIPILSFEDFLGQIVPQCSDPHWEPQAIRMAPKYWNKINFVGKFENLYEDTKRLLVHIGAWEQFGASGWIVDGVDGAIFDPKQKAVHGTKARTSKAEYFTPQALQSIQQFYERDYQHTLLHFAVPAAARM